MTASIRGIAVAVCMLLAPPVLGQGIGPGALDQDSNELFRYSAGFSGAIDEGYPGSQPTMAITFDRAVAGTYAAETGGQVFTVNGAPVKKADGTWPAGLSGSQGNSWSFDGAADYLSLAAASAGAFNPSDDLTVFAVVTPSTVAAGEDCIAGKYETTGNEKGWKLCRSADGVVFTTSVDGAADTAATKATALAANRTACIVAVYDKSATTGTVYVDELAAATNASMSAGINASGADFEIGASDTGATLWAGKMHTGPVVWQDAATAAEARHLCRQWRGLVAETGQEIAVSSAAPPAILIAPPDSGTQPFLVDMPVNVMQVGKASSTATVGGTSPSAISNLAHRRSFETWAAGSPTGWTETSGGGTSDATQNTANMAHGGSSAQLLCDGVNAIQLDSACKALSGSTAYWADAYGETLAGTATAYVQLTECTDGACSVECVTTTLWTGDPGADWQVRGNTRTTGAGVNSGLVTIKMDTTSATAVFDAVSLYTGNTGKRSFCPGDTDATASCTAIVPSAFTNIPANGEVTIGLTASSPWAGTALAVAASVLRDGPIGNNTIYWVVDAGTDEALLATIDNSGNFKYINPNIADWAANTEYAVRVRTDGTGNLGLYWNSAWQTTMAGAGTGMRSAAQSITYFGSTGTVGHDIDWGKILIQRGVQP